MYRTILSKLEHKYFSNVQMQYRKERDAVPDDYEVEPTGLIIGQCGGCHIVLVHLPHFETRFQDYVFGKLDYKTDTGFADAFVVPVNEQKKLFILFKHKDITKIIQNRPVIFEQNLYSEDETDENILFELVNTSEETAGNHKRKKLIFKVTNDEAHKINSVEDETGKATVKIRFNSNGYFKGFKYKDIQIDFTESDYKAIVSFFDDLGDFTSVTDNLRQGEFLKNNEIVFAQAFKDYLLPNGVVTNDDSDDLTIFANSPEIAFLFSKYLLQELSRNELFIALNEAIKYAQKSKTYDNDADKEQQRAYYILMLLWSIIKRFESHPGKEMYKNILNGIIEDEIHKIEAYKISSLDTISGIELQPKIIQYIKNTNQNSLDNLIDGVTKFFLGEPPQPSNAAFFADPFQKTTSLTKGRKMALKLAGIIKKHDNKKSDYTEIKKLQDEFCFNTINLVASFSIYWLEKEKRHKFRKKHNEKELEKINLGNFI